MHDLDDRQMLVAVRSLVLELLTLQFLNKDLQKLASLR